AAHYSYNICMSDFFFQAEDGIRDFHVTGVQTCALPIWNVWGWVLWFPWRPPGSSAASGAALKGEDLIQVRQICEQRRRPLEGDRSEERREGKECSTRWLQSHYKNLVDDS